MDDSKYMYRSLYHDFFELSPPEVLEETEDLLHGHPNLHQLEPVRDEELEGIWLSAVGGDLEAETPLAIFVFTPLPATVS
jgi:hypothetical protein